MPCSALTCRLLLATVLPSVLAAFSLASAQDSPTKFDCGKGCEMLGRADAPKVVIFLHGASGPVAYKAFASRLADAGYLVVFPHYLEQRPLHGASDADYIAWSALVNSIANESHRLRPDRPTIAFGVSLGASVALAAATQNQWIAAAVDWSGSLPDVAFYTMQRLPPLLVLHGRKDTSVPVFNAEQLVKLCDRAQQQCESHIYPSEGHLFPGEINDAWKRTFAFLQSVK